MKNYDGVFVGIVVDTKDPRKIGRIRVRVQNVFDKINIEDIPWSSPHASLGGKAFEFPALGKVVRIEFDNGNIYSPIYIYSWNYNINLQDKLESLSDDDYQNFGALTFDDKTRIYSETDKLTIDFLINKILLNNKSINLEIKDNSNKITLGSENANQNAVLGQHFIMDWLLTFCNLLINPTTLTGNLGAPILKPDLDAHLQKFISNPQQFISKNVFISDNDAITTLSRDSATSEVEHDDTQIVDPSQKGPANIENSEYIDDSTKDNIQSQQSAERTTLQNAQPVSDTAISNINLYSGITSTVYSDPNTVNYNGVDQYNKKVVNRTNPNSKSPYTIDQRGRNDVLASPDVSNRNVGSNQLAINPNYGSYISH
jgi:hypothetical protein